MNYTTLNSLNDLLKNLKSDAVTIGLTIASLMIVIYVILVMVDIGPEVGVHKDRWAQLRKVFLCAFLIAAAGTLVSFGDQLGNAIHI